MSTSPSPAVFLSYASQDAEAARRICDGLRSGGMAVWFDADGGLEHGDEWDAKIRRQIKECVLFIPILSANTQARLEGYFRIEWELAAERAMGIAAGVPFILPIVIDGTREPDALVPDRFRRVQWIRIPGGEVTPEVQARLVKLWSHRTGVLAHEAARTATATTPPRPFTQPSFPNARGLAAVVFTDVVGYSARMQHDETGTMALVKADFAVMSERCAEHGGEVLNSMGDGLLMCFASAVQAVTCALQIQSEFGRRRGTLPAEQTLEHRMGVHIGDVFRQETGGVAGDGVNIAARLEGKAPVGGVCISQMVYDTVKGKVPMQAVFVGPESFKNITEPIPIWHIAAADGVTPSRAPFPSARKRLPPWLWPTVAAAAMAVVATGAWFFRHRPAPPTPAPVVATSPRPTQDAPKPTALTKPRGIAVLPFENLDAPDQAAFTAGVTVEVTDRLQKISALRVISSKAVERFKGGAAELPAMTRELAIGAILTGSVRRAGDVVRISVQLLAAPSGETLWSESYNGQAKDIFGVQADVALRVARALQASLAPQERARIERPPTTDTEAYTLYLQSGRYSIFSVKQNSEGIALLQKAIGLDPKFALAYSSLARRYQFLGNTTGRDDLNRALEAARTAVAIDPQLARGHYVLGNALAAVGQVDDARLAAQRSIELDSNFHAAFNDLSVIEFIAGRFDQAVYWAKRGFPLAPNLAVSYYHVGGPLLLLDDVAAERWLQAGVARFPVNHPTGGHRLQLLLAVIEIRRGQLGTALQRLRAAVAALPGHTECLSLLTELALATDAPDATELVENALKSGPDARIGYSSYTPRAMRAFLWLKAGNRPNALPLIEAAFAANRTALAAGDRSSLPLCENIALELMRGDRAAAMDWLERAYQAGFKDSALLKADPLVAPLLAEPRFLQVLERMDRDLREMRARVDLRELDALAKTGQP